MVLYPRAKINWTLNVLGKRDDGYHDLDMLMQTISLCDEMTVDPADKMSLEVICDTGEIIPNDDDNLIIKAANALRPHAHNYFDVKISLKKVIPSGAGLGGGSADAAVALRALNRIWNAGLGENELGDIGMSIGSDVPYCLTEKFARVRGRGEYVSPLDGAPDANLIIIMPCEGLSTGRVFSACKSGMVQPMDEAAEQLRAADWAWLRDNTRNDLEAAACRLRPEIARCIDDMYNTGARFARMTGSGAAVFGVFDADVIADAYKSLGACWPRIYEANTLR